MQNLSAHKGKKVFVGLSGGVDSAVTAALLQKAGAQVTGVFIKGWYPPGMPCTWAEDRRDAMRVAAHLRIPFHTLDARVEYKKGVIDYLLSEYAAGHTPNPDIMCNREVKFGAFYEFAKANGTDYIATGHYARSRAPENFGADSFAAPGEVSLLRGLDASKDQSYFLWAIPRDALAMTVFPLGEYPKTEVRELAKKFDLPVAEKKDSQGICFLGSISVEDFLRKEFASKITPGIAYVLRDDGTKEALGVHGGALLYTLGARIALQPLAGASAVEAGPWYVIGKDMKANTLIVSKDLTDAVGDSQRPFRLREVNWFKKPEPKNSLQETMYEAQYRYHGPIVRGTVRIEDSENQDESIFIPEENIDEPVASGQSLVLYRGEECVGGGIIS